MQRNRDQRLQSRNWEEQFVSVSQRNGMTWLPAQLDPLSVHQSWRWRVLLCQSQSCSLPTNDPWSTLLQCSSFPPFCYLGGRNCLWYRVAGNSRDAKKEVGSRRHIIFESSQRESYLRGPFRWSIHWQCVTIHLLPLYSYRACLLDTSHWSGIWLHLNHLCCLGLSSHYLLHRISLVAK